MRDRSTAIFFGDLIPLRGGGRRLCGDFYDGHDGDRPDGRRLSAVVDGPY